MTKDALRDKANDLPLAPGVYLMMDKSGKVIYVGKAKRLKNRVSQYFQDSVNHTVKTRLMVSQVDHFDTIFVSSEFEALILENSLIKRHMPHYNILLKDDKGYPFVRLSRETYPRFSMYVEILPDAQINDVVVKQVLQEHLTVYFKYFDSDYSDLKKLLNMEPLQITILKYGTIAGYQREIGHTLHRINPGMLDVTGLLRYHTQPRPRGEAAYR